MKEILSDDGNITLICYINLWPSHLAPQSSLRIVLFSLHTGVGVQQRSEIFGEDTERENKQTLKRGKCVNKSLILQGYGQD